MRYETHQAREIARRAAINAGASDDVATSLANAVVAAERAGKRSVGFAHLTDYLDGFAKGRIAGSAQPDIAFPAPAAIRVDAKGGIAQLGFDRAFDQFVERLSTALGRPVATGVFGADMQVSLLNDGPMTIAIDSRDPE